MKNMSLILSAAAVCTTTGMSASVAAQTEIQLWYGYKDYFAPVFEKTIGTFNASQDDYVVTWQGYDDYPTTMQAVVAAYRAGNHPPLAMIYDVGTATMTSSGAIRPMQQVMEDAGYSIQASEFINGAVNYYANADGSLSALPFFASTLLTYANMDKLEAAGIDGIPGTWEQMETALQALKGNGESCPFAHKINAWRDLEQFAAVHNAPIATKRNGYDGTDAAMELSSELHLRHTQNLIDWTQEGLMVLQGDLGGLNTTNAFKAGDCAMFFGSTGSYAGVLDEASFNWSVAPIPVYEGHDRHNSFIGGNALWILEGHDEDVYMGIASLLDFIRRDDVQEQFMRSTGYIPVTVSSYEAMLADSVFETDEYAGLGVAIDSLSQPAGQYSRGIRLGFYPQIRKAWKTQVERAYTGEITVEEALVNATEEANDLLERFARTAQ